MFEYDNYSYFWDSAMLIVWTSWDDNGNMFGTGSLGGGGTSSSTTETIYGVYDMMSLANWDDRTNFENAMTVYNSNASNSGFDSTWLNNNKKYYDNYINNITGLLLNGNNFTESKPWILLNGDYVSQISDGSANQYNGFRITLINK